MAAIGDVEFLIGCLMLILQRRHGEITAAGVKRLERYLVAGSTTPNKHFMGVVAYYIVMVLLPLPVTKPAQATRKAAIERAASLLQVITSDELANGPTWRELWCPGSHQGMYKAAQGVLVWFGLGAPVHSFIHQIALSQVELMARELAAYDLVATQYGEVHAMIGERCDGDPQRDAMTFVYREIRQRAHLDGVDYRHRNYKGRLASIERQCAFHELDGDSGLWYGPVWAWRKILDERQFDLVALLPVGGALPHAAPLRIDIWHFDGGARVVLYDPGIVAHPDWETHGSFAARRSPDNDEDTATCVTVWWGAAPCAYRLEVIHTWEREVPALEAALNPVLVATIPAVA